MSRDKVHWFLRYTKSEALRLTKNQVGFAPIALVVLLLFGIGAGVFLVQNGVNFLPKAALADPYAPVKETVDKLYAETGAGVYIELPNGTVIAKDENSSKPAYSVIKLWIAGAVFSNNKYSQLKSDVDTMLTVPDIPKSNEAANNLIKALGNNNEAQGLRVINNYILENYSETSVNRLMLAQPPPDNYTSPRSAVNFIKSVMNNGISNNGGQVIQNLLTERTRLKGDWFPDKNSPVLSSNAQFIGKSGTGAIVPVRNDVGTFLDKNDQRVYFAILVPTGGDSSETKISNLEQALYNGGQAVPAAAPAGGQTPGISTGTCTTDQITRLGCPTVNNKPRCIITDAGSPQCQYPEDISDRCNNTHYEKCKNNASSYELETSLCYVIDGVPRCEYKSSATECNPGDAACPNGTTCQFFTKKVNNKDIKYTACVKSSPARAAPGAKTAAPEKFACKGTDLVDTKLPGNGCIAKCREKPEGSSGLCSIDMTACEGLGSSTCIGDAQAGKLTNTVCGSIADNGRTFTGVVDKDHPKVVYDTCNGGTLNCKQYGNIASCRTVPPATAATAECGFDKDGLGIPCYKIGVFSPEDLLSTEAGARLASERYTQFSEIITKLTGQINADIIAAANAKLKAAQDAAKACLAGK